MDSTSLNRLAAALTIALLASGCPKTETPDPVITSVHLTPAGVTIETGQTQQYTATANRSDGSSQVLTSGVTWVSSNTAVATVDGTGLATGVATVTGSTTLSATYQGMSGLTTLTVARLLKSIVIEGPPGAVPATFDVQLGLTGSWSGGATGPVTSGVTWDSYDTGVATVDANGLLHGVAPGTTTVTATCDGLTALLTLTVSDATLASIAVTPATATIVEGQSVRLEVVGTFSDATSMPLASTMVSWADDGSGHAQIDASGLVTAVAPVSPGTTTFTATVAGAAPATADVTVNAATLLSLALDPPSASVPAGRTVLYTLTATYDTGPRVIAGADASWNASGATVVDGLVSSTTPANYTVTAWYGGMWAAAALTVTDAVVESVTLSPSSATIQIGATQQFTVDVAWSDALVTHAATFETSDAGVATIDPTTGLATGTAAGTATLTATVDGLSDTSTLTVQTGPVGPALDGTIAYPGDFPWSTTHTSASAMRFEVTGLTPGQAYELPIYGLTGDTWVELLAFADRLFIDDIGDGYAWVDTSGSGGAPLRFVADGDGTIYLRVFSGLGTTWTLGTPTAYVGPTLTATLYFPSSFPFGAPSDSADRYYRVSGLTPGEAYTVDLTSTAGYGLAVFANPAFLAPACGGGWGATSCGFVASAAGDVYVQVLSHGSAGTFTLDVTARPAITPAATLVYPASFAFASSVADGGVVWYRVTGLDPSAPFLNAIDGGPLLWVFGDRYATDLLCEADSFSGADACFANPPPSGEVWLAVDGSYLGGAFTLNLSSLGPLGTLVYPGTFTFSSTAGLLSAVVWQVTGLTPGAVYAFELGGVDEPTSAGVVPDTSFTASLCWVYAGLAVDGMCIFTAPSSGVAYLAVDATQSTSGTPYTLDLRPIASATPTPLAYPGDFVFAGSVGTGVSLYEVTGLSPYQRYTVTLGGLSANADLYVYEDAVFASMECGSAGAGTAEERCDAWADGSGAAYVLVSGRDTGAGATFSLDVFPWAAPWTAASYPSELPALVTMSNWEDGYVRIDGLTPGTSYTVTLRDLSGGVDLDVYSDAAMTSSLCGSWQAGTTPESCAATAPASGQLYVVARNDTSSGSATFILGVLDTAALAWTTVDAATQLPYGGAVGTADSYYEVTGLTPYAPYTVTLSGMTGDVDLYVYDDSALATLQCSSTASGTATETCVVYPDAYGRLLVVANSYYAAAGTTFTLDVVPYSFPTANLAYPGAFPHGDSVTAGGYVLYDVTGLTPGLTYTFSLTALSDDADLYVMYDATFTAPACSSAYSGTGDESCAASTSTGTLYVWVDGYNATIGTGFTLDVTP
jgi:uncharacterized protein YjdB